MKKQEPLWGLWVDKERGWCLGPDGLPRFSHDRRLICAFKMAWESEVFVLSVRKISESGAPIFEGVVNET